MGKTILLSFFVLCLGILVPFQTVRAGTLACGPYCCTQASDCAQYATHDACAPMTGVTYYSCENKNAQTGLGSCYWGCGVCNYCNGKDCGIAYSYNCSEQPPPGDYYDYTTCPAGQALSCGSTAEAVAQNKTGCRYPITCNKYYWPSYRSLPQCRNDPPLQTCYANCSCCPTGEIRACTQGSQYIKSITVDLTNGDAVVIEARKITCNTHDDIFVSNVLVRDYHNQYDAHFQDWDLTCITNTCVCTSPITPTPVPVGNITARAVEVDPADTSCAAIQAVPTTGGQINGATHQFTPSSASQPVAQTQSGANYVTFSTIVTGTYTLDTTPPTSDWAYTRACWTNNTTGDSGESLSATLGANETLQWDVGYTLGTAWVQTEGGDVYASGSLRSYLPAVSPRVFNTDGTGGYPGVVTYGTSVDFDSDPFEDGASLASSYNWLVNESHTSMDYYDLFYRRFGVPTTQTTDPAFSNLLAVTQPPSSTTPYYVVGDMITSGNWVSGTNETIVVLVNGNLTIGGNVNITGTGFIAFIVNGTITVDSAVGTTAASTSPSIEGVYIATTANQGGGIYTGLSTANATARLVGKGMFISDNFYLERDLDGFGGNVNSAAELFVYNPRLLLSMPEAMKDQPVMWQEVAP